MSADHAQPHAEGKTPLIAIIGQPNVGKTSVFNRLTGLRQRVGNYPGVTVERKAGRLTLGGREVEIVDLPGTYSLNALSPDELITVAALSGKSGVETRPDLVLCVVEATRIERSLLPAFQVAPLGVPVVIAVNFLDEARKMGAEIDLDEIARRLGVPVVGTVGRTGEGIPALRAAMERALESGAVLHEPNWPEAVKEALDMLQPHARDGAGRSCRFLAQRLLFDTSGRAAAIIGGDPSRALALLEESRRKLLNGGHHPSTAEPVLLFAHIRKILDGAVRLPGNSKPSAGADAIFAHPVFGLILFALVMFGVFQAVYSWAGPLMDAIESATGRVGERVGAMLEPFPMLQSLAVDGIVAGVGSVVIFLPQILILTLLIALLEDSGYLARAAFLIDRVFGWCGLNGKSFVPLMSGFACAIPGIMAARTIEESRTRLATIFITPLMSCSARLPVYVLMIGAVIEPRHGPAVAGLTLFAMHFLGPVVALPLAWVLNRFVLKSAPPPFLLELPPFRMPSPSDLLHRVWQRARRFLTDAGTLIFCITILIWALLYFPRNPAIEIRERSAFIAEKVAQGADRESLEQSLNDPGSDEAEQLGRRIAGAHIENSLLGRAGKLVQPVFDPAGFDWKLTVAVLASFPAREVVIATLGVIHNLGGDTDEESGDLRAKIQEVRWTEGKRKGEPVFTIPAAVSLMVFFALCMQCGATLAIIKAESGWKWAVAAFGVMTALAWIGATISYQILSVFLPGGGAS